MGGEAGATGAIGAVGALAEHALDDVEERLASLIRGGGAQRRAMAGLAGRLVARRAFELLGYARLGDYARERLGVSARTLQELARVDAALPGLPRLEAALVTGALPWSKVRLVARFASAEDEGHYIARAKALPVRALERAFRAVDRGAVRSDTDPEPRAQVSLRAPRRVAFQWQRTCRYAAQAFDVEGALPEGDEARCTVTVRDEDPAPDLRVASVCASYGPEEETPRLLPRNSPTS